MAETPPTVDEPAARDDPPGSQERTPWRVEGARDSPDKGSRAYQMPGGRRLLWILLVMLAVNWLIVSRASVDHQRITVPYSYFRQQATVGNIAEVSSKGETILGKFRRNVRYPAGKKARVTHLFKTERPAFADDAIFGLLLAKNVKIDAKSPDSRSLLSTVLFGFGPTLLLVGLFVLLMRRAQGGQGGMLGKLGKSKAKRYDASAQRTTFADVAGIDEVTDELAEVVGFLKDPDRYRRLGGMIPRGVLLSVLQAPARRCWRVPWRARPRCRSSRCRRRSSWR